MDVDVDGVVLAKRRSSALGRTAKSMGWEWGMVGVSAWEERCGCCVVVWKPCIRGMTRLGLGLGLGDGTIGRWEVVIARCGLEVSWG